MYYKRSCVCIKHLYICLHACRGISTYDTREANVVVVLSKKNVILIYTFLHTWLSFDWSSLHCQMWKTKVSLKVLVNLNSFILPLYISLISPLALLCGRKTFLFMSFLVVDYISSSCCAPQFLPNICAACMVPRRQVETVIVSSSSPHFISLTHISDISHRLHRLSQSQSKISHKSLACTTKSCFHILPDTEARQSALQNKEQFVSSIHNLY